MQYSEDPRVYTQSVLLGGCVQSTQQHFAFYTSSFRTLRYNDLPADCSNKVYTLSLCMSGTPDGSFQSGGAILQDEAALAAAVVVGIATAAAPQIDVDA